MNEQEIKRLTKQLRESAMRERKRLYQLAKKTRKSNKEN